mmetsp:Transcript_21963/g.30872  ORF Transcript_21963/g.30872 Transcript_21963/m.30872 type:complete len:120 (-) Transcript_21963:20-379(-)
MNKNQHTDITFSWDSMVPPAHAQDDTTTSMIGHNILQSESKSNPNLQTLSPSKTPTPTSLQSCEEECLAQRKRIIEERRAMMRQSRSSTNRNEVFELSKQRASMYNTTYRGASCPPNIP